MVLYFLKQKFPLALCTVFMAVSVFSQEKGIKIIHAETQEQVLLKENTRIRIKLMDETVVSGVFQIADSNSIFIKNERIDLARIQKIKPHPARLSAAISVIMAVTTFITAVSAFAYLFVDSDTASWLGIGAVASLGLAIKPPNILKGYKASDGWRFEILYE